MARARLSRTRVVTPALLLRKVVVGESDVIVHLLTEELGALGAIARGARRSRKRFSSLEPMHQLRVTLDLVAGRELANLVEADIARARVSLTSSLAALDAAGAMLRWLRRAAPARTPEPELWSLGNELLDAVDRGEPAPARLAAYGVRMLRAVGWELDLNRCVRCDTAVPPNARVRIDVHAGGVVCQRCGGGPLGLSARQRKAMLGAHDDEAAFDVADARAAIDLVDHALQVHGSGDAT